MGRLGGRSPAQCLDVRHCLSGQERGKSHVGRSATRARDLARRRYPVNAIRPAEKGQKGTGLTSGQASGKLFQPAANSRRRKEDSSEDEPPRPPRKKRRIAKRIRSRIPHGRSTMIEHLYRIRLYEQAHSHTLHVRESPARVMQETQPPQARHPLSWRNSRSCPAPMKRTMTSKSLHGIPYTSGRAFKEYTIGFEPWIKTANRSVQRSDVYTKRRGEGFR